MILWHWKPFRHALYPPDCTMICKSLHNVLFMITYHTYIKMILLHRNIGCLTSSINPWAGWPIFFLPAQGFSWIKIFSFPFLCAIFCSTSSASLVLPWEYNHRGDSGTVLHQKVGTIKCNKKHWIYRSLKGTVLMGLCPPFTVCSIFASFRDFNTSLVTIIGLRWIETCAGQP